MVFKLNKAHLQALWGDEGRKLSSPGPVISCGPLLGEERDGAGTTGPHCMGQHLLHRAYNPQTAQLEVAGASLPHHLPHMAGWATAHLLRQQGDNTAHMELCLRVLLGVEPVIGGGKRKHKRVWGEAFYL